MGILSMFRPFISKKWLHDPAESGRVRCSSSFEKKSGSMPPNLTFFFGLPSVPALAL